MIPRRMKLTGFLSYQHEQELRFDDQSLWLLAGPNGSGKSSIFDALTFALFGSHRAGSSNNSELINKQSTGFAIEFDFEIDRELYRIKRTLKRTPKGNFTATQQLSHYDAAAKSWSPVADTSKKTEFDRWIDEHIGLSFKSFVASVLLRQGETEKLLNSLPAERAEVLAGIVQLDRFQQLHERANTQRLALKGQLESLAAQVNSVPEVPEAEWLEAQTVVQLAEETRRHCSLQIDAAQANLAAHQRWQEARTRHYNATLKREQAEKLLAQSNPIETRFARFLELQQVLPAVHFVVTTRAKFVESERRSEQFQRQKQDQEDLRIEQLAQLKQQQQARDQFQKQLSRDEGELQQAQAALRELAGQLQAANHAEEQLATVHRLQQELALFASDSATERSQLETRLHQLEELQRVLPILERWRGTAAEWQQTTESLKQEAAQLEKLKTDGLAAKTEADLQATKWAELQSARLTAQQAHALAAAKAQQTQELFHVLREQAGQSSCRACGQPLTPEHLQSERLRRQAERDMAAAALAQSERSLAQATQTEASQQTRHQTAQDTLSRLREHYTTLAATIAERKKTIGSQRDRLRLTHAELPAAYVARFPDGAESAGPSDVEFSGWHQELRSLETTRSRVRETLQQHERQARKQAECENAERTLARLRQTLPDGDVATFRAQQQAQLQREQSLLTVMKATKQNLQKAEAALDLARVTEHTATRRVTELVGHLKNEDTIRSNATENIRRESDKLPTEWQFRVAKAGLTEYSHWQTEQKTLEADGIAGEHAALVQARAGLATLQETERLLGAEAAAFPPDIQQPLATLQGAEQAARLAYDAADRTLGDAHRRRQLLETYRARRAELGEQHRTIDREHQQLKILAELLGRDRLQRHLVRQAERQIVDHANSVLDRLSAGQLYLRLVAHDDGGTDKAFDLECVHRAAGG
ncbi:MAG: ATP-binding protein, partial [Gemmataceae bacterium]